MRLAVLSDIHGNLPALEAVLAGAGQVDGFVIAGDLTGAGPFQVETIQRLRALPAWIIRGNSDSYMLRLADGDAPSGWRTSQQWAPARWAFRHLDAGTLAFLRSLPEQRTVKLPGAAALRVVHGSPRDPCEQLDPQGNPDAFDVALAEIDQTVLVCGHTHIPWVATRGERLALNPGAVSASLNGDPRAQYALLTWDGGRWQAELRAVAYDLALVRAAFQQSGLLAEGGALARAFLCAIESGQDIALELLHHAERLASADKMVSEGIFADSLWERAVATFPWPDE